MLDKAFITYIIEDYNNTYLIQNITGLVPGTYAVSIIPKVRLLPKPKENWFDKHRTGYARKKSK